MTATEAIAAIEAGQRGPNIGAFFDFDGTLIDGYSATAYFTDRFHRREMTLAEATEIIRMIWRRDMNESQFAGLMAKAIAAWAGHREEDVAELWSRLFKDKIASLLFPEAWNLVKAHQRMGHTVAIASSATRYQTTPLAKELGIEHVLCSPISVHDGRMTGCVEGIPLWGAGKAQAVCDFANTHGIALANSYGYANGNEDVAFLKTVGHATAVDPKPALMEAAQREGWTVLRFPTRRKASMVTRARSFGAYCALAATSLGGLAYAKTTGKNRRAAELVSAISSDLMLAIAGIEVEIQGEHHLWAHRPSVFMFNHQSITDGYVLLTLLRRGITGVAKKRSGPYAFPWADPAWAGLCIH